MKTPTKCPICQNRYGAECNEASAIGIDAEEFCCNQCGKFRLTGSLFASKFFKTPSSLSNVQRSVLSHFILKNQSTEPILIDSIQFEHLLSSSLPSPSNQGNAIVRLVGDHVKATGEHMSELPANLYAVIGSSSQSLALHVARQLHEESILTGRLNQAIGKDNIHDVNLSLRGWNSYDEQRRGKINSDIAFIALKFGAPELDALLKEVIKPAVAELGFGLVDMRDVTQPGIIDNVMRDQIRQAPFVLVDLTHDNLGAYWEAGYAEGLGKPVLYICEKNKFDNAKTHFDVNHCTTVMWGGEKTKRDFAKELQATIRNSSVIFPRN